MRKIWILISVIVLIIIGCTKTSYEDVISVESPNWTSDGKIVFVREKEVWKVEEDIGVRTEIVSDSTWLYEINADGSGRENKGLLFEDTEFGGGGLSSAGEWVVFGDADNNIWVVRRNGTSLQEVGSGRNPDFSPDASRIVYEKPDEGIWIMDRDGDNDHQIISDVDVLKPAWSLESDLLGYFSSYGLIISNTNGDEQYTFLQDTIGDTIYGVVGGSGVDWSVGDSLVVYAAKWERDHIASMERGFLILKMNSDTALDFNNMEASSFRWSPNGLYLTGNDQEGFFVINRNGTNKWYLEP